MGCISAGVDKLDENMTGFVHHSCVTCLVAGIQVADAGAHHKDIDDPGLLQGPQ